MSDDVEGALDGLELEVFVGLAAGRLGGTATPRTALHVRMVARLIDVRRPLPRMPLVTRLTAARPPRRWTRRRQGPASAPAPVAAEQTLELRDALSQHQHRATEDHVLRANRGELRLQRGSAGGELSNGREGVHGAAPVGQPITAVKPPRLGAELLRASHVGGGLVDAPRLRRVHPSRRPRRHAHAVYDALFAGRPPRGSAADAAQGPPPKEVGCWSHCRRGFWEAAVCKHVEGLEGLRRIDAIFAADRALADLPPVRRKARRDALVRPLVDAFFAWVDAELMQARGRGVVSSALGYARNQAGPLRRFLEDGRLRLENNAAERTLRPVAAARRTWLFFGSDDHASAAANLFSLVASCKLHGLDPEDYFRDVLRAMPHWPRDRYLELTPLKWATARARIDAEGLARVYRRLTVPAPSAAEDETASG